MKKDFVFWFLVGLVWTGFVLCCLLFPIKKGEIQEGVPIERIK